MRYRAQNNYANGQKRCKTCEQFITWNGLVSPCCRHKLRMRPRNPRLYEKMRAKSNNNTIGRKMPCIIFR
jgi:hypothetical protein